VESLKAKSFLRVGVTGGIGSGKSLVCHSFRELGRKVIEADTIARVLVDTDEGVHAEIRDTFGNVPFSHSGALDRKALARIVFTHPSKRRALNAIVHPRVFERIEDSLRSSPSGELQPFVVIEAALMYETGMERTMDYVLVVNAAEETRIRRVMTRDGMSRKDVLLRMDAQLPAEAKVKKADFVVENNGTPGELAERIRFINQLLTLLTPTGHR
jgi:dephospho-CoA kinase